MNQHINQAGIDLIKEFEGYRDTAYPDPGTGREPWTIGYGSTTWNGKRVVQGQKCTEQEAEAQLQHDLRQFEKTVEETITVPLDTNQFSALVSFCYNVGPRAFRESTLVRKLNQGQYHEASDEFPRWNKAAGRVLLGLVRRREAERQLFLTPVTPLTPVMDETCSTKYASVVGKTIATVKEENDTLVITFTDATIFVVGISWHVYTTLTQRDELV